MSQISFNIGAVTKAVEERIEAALETIGNQGVSWASDRWRANGYSPATPERERSGNLVNSLTYSTDKVKGPLKGKTDGTQLQLSDKALSVRIGTNVVYAARVEFGFVGRDSLGRYFNQAAKSYLRAGILANKGGIMKIMTRALRRA